MKRNRLFKLRPGVDIKYGVLRKLNSNSGFTLTETLSTLLIMSLVGLMISAGIVTAVNVYRQVTEYSEAQVLLTNTLTVLEDELVYAEPDSIPDPISGGSITFSHVKDGNTKIAEVVKDGINKGICISYYKSGDWTEAEPLVTYEKNEDLYTDWNIKNAVSQSDKTKIITIDLSVKSGTDTIIEITDYKIQTLNSKK